MHKYENQQHHNLDYGVQICIFNYTLAQVLLDCT